MSRKHTLVESIACDVCGRPLKKSSPVSIAFAGKKWALDLCDRDQRTVGRQIEQWTASARVTSRRSERQAEDEWTYLESLGFTRHRGRKSAAERAALAGRQ